MPRFVVLLRAVHVGMAQRVPMAAFRELIESLRSAEICSYSPGQSGHPVTQKGFAGSVVACKARVLVEQIGQLDRVCTRAGLERQDIAKPPVLKAIRRMKSHKRS